MKKNYKEERKRDMPGEGDSLVSGDRTSIRIKGENAGINLPRRRWGIR